MAISPLVLIVEDRPDGPSARIREYLAAKSDISVELLHPAEITESVLRKADVVVVDYRLDNWEERAAQTSISLQPWNGVSLAAVLRSLLAPEEIGNDLAAFCLLTQHPEDLSGSSSYERRPQVLARSKDLDWVFSKEKPRDVGRQLVALARAVQNVKALTTGSQQTAQSIVAQALDLALTGNASEEAAWLSVERCQPPIVEIGEWRVPMSLIRWFLHRVLPYTGFLLDHLHLAVQLRVTPESLRVCLEGESQLTRVLDSCSYSGILHDFGGHRWWRATIDSMLWEKRGGGQASIERFREQLLEESAGTLVFLNIQEPVVCLNEKLEASDVQELADTVKLNPDDWPSYALAPRALVDVVKASPRLKLLTASEDLELLELDSGKGV